MGLLELFFYELRKTVASKALLAIIMLCLGISIAYQWSETRSGGQYDQYSGLRGAFWSEELEKTKGTDRDKLKQYFEIEGWYHGLLAAEENGQDIESSLMEFQELYPDVDMEARLHQSEEVPEEMSHLTMHKFYNNIVSRLTYQESYPQFRESIQQKADELEDLALFSDISGYSSRNIIQTAETYRKLGDLTLEYDYSAAIYMGTNTVMVDMMLLFLVILLGWQIFCRERENGIYPILQTAKRGGMAFISAKLAAYFLMLAILSFLLYAAQFLFAFSLYGIGNLNVALQSLSEYRNCVLPVSIGTYIWLFLGIKVAVCLVFGSLIVFFMIAWKRFVPAVCTYFGVALIEYALYTTVNSLSKWNWFRYVNLFSVLDASQPFTVYWNLNLFSYPIWAEFAKMVLCIATIFLCMVLSILIYCREREGKRVHSIASGRRIAVRSFGGKHVSIFVHEGYKFYVLGGMGVFLIVAVIVSMRMAEGIPSHTGTTEIQAYRYYIEQLQGTYTEETRAWLEKETQIMQMTDQEAFETQEQFQNGEISLETYTDWMEKRQQLIEMRSRGFYKILAQEQVIKNAKENGFENAGFVDQYKLSYLFKDENNQMFLACVLLSALILGVSGLFGIEERNGMMALLQSTQKGRQPLQRRKLLQTILCATVLYVILYVPYYVAIWRDLSEVDASLVLNGVPGYQKLSVPLSIRQAFVVMFALRYLAAVICSIITAAVTSAVKKQALGSVICFLLFLGPCILYLWKVNLSGVSVVGGLLPQLTFQNGQVMLYGVYWIAMLAAVGGSLYWMRKRIYTNVR